MEIAAGYREEAKSTPRKDAAPKEQMSEQRRTRT